MRNDTNESSPLHGSMEEVVKDNWKHDGVEDRNAIVKLKNKLKYLKIRLKLWSKSKVDERCNSRKMWQAKLEEIDKRVDDGHGVANDIQERKQIMKLILDADRMETLDLAQKAKVKWAIKGDENSKYFHGIINKKRRQLAIRGILIDGEWVDDPIRVKQEFYHHFATRFEAPNWSRAGILDEFPNRLSSEQSRMMEGDVSCEEVKRAMWECGSDKAPGPDGFTFEFFKKFWYVVGEDVVRAVSRFFTTGWFPRGCNSSFVALIPKVHDAKLVNEFRPISLVGCPYKIIGKILANRLALAIDDLISTRFAARRPIISVLVPSSHGKPSCLRSEDYGTWPVFTNPSRELPKVTLSNSFYADDAIFIGKWSHDNVISIARLLQCFYMASGLNVNFHKSTLLGIDVPYQEVECMASNMGCKAEKCRLIILVLRLVKICLELNREER
ncbi:hypothetical protein Tco_0978053 [Tanacetum coccineum]|uniref:Reverse transcriptase n=1 Tax=Tanacetum coccineum TaxID=301880 RepID=A0ABQ5ELV8_9ASTR